MKPMSKHFGWTSMAGALILAASSVAVAQDRDAANSATQPLDTIRKVSNLLKADVDDVAGNKIANLADLIMDRQGRPHYAILGAGGVLGIGEEHIAVPFSKLQTLRRNEDGKWTVSVPMSKDQIERAPTIKGDDFRVFTSADWLQKNNEYFQMETDRTGQPAALFRASTLLGSKVVNAQSEDLATIDDMLLDRQGNAVYAILGAGGVLGIGEDHLAVPFRSLNLTYNAPDNKAVASLNTTRDKLEAAPRMQGNSYESLNDPDYVVKVTRYYVVDTPDESR